VFLQVFSVFIFVALAITKMSSCSDCVAFDVSTTTSEPCNILDAPLRPQCPKGERYYKGTCRKVFQRIVRGREYRGHRAAET
jgi:hypothetical protein